MVLGGDFTRGSIKKALDIALQTTGQQVTIKKLSGSSPGDPLKGVGPTYTFTTVCANAIIVELTQEDKDKTGGLYQLGDLNVQIEAELVEVSDNPAHRGIGDRLVWRGSEYRVVGKGNPTVINGKVQFFSYYMRKVKT